MTVIRPTMIELITRVRSLIGDPSGTDQVFTDQELQNALDMHRVEVGYEALEPLVSYSGGVAQYLEWGSSLRNWESSAALVDAQYAVLTPSAADYQNGRWTFTISQATVLISGRSFDVYAAAADMLETWAVKAAMEYDFSTDGASFHRSQKQQALRNLADVYRRKQNAGTIRMIRSDLANDRDE